MKLTKFTYPTGTVAYRKRFKGIYRSGINCSVTFIWWPNEG